MVKHTYTVFSLRFLILVKQSALKIAKSKPTVRQYPEPFLCTTLSRICRSNVHLDILLSYLFILKRCRFRKGFSTESVKHLLWANCVPSLYLTVAFHYSKNILPVYLQKILVMCQCKFLTYIWHSYFLKCSSAFCFQTDVTVFFLQRNRAIQKIVIMN